MGTGGSLRLLSPEIGRGPRPIAAAFTLRRFNFRQSLASVSTASPQGFASASTFVSAFASQLRLRTLKTAQVALAFASALRFRSARLTMARFYFALRHSLSLRLRARLLSLASASFLFLQDQALDRLVSSSSMPYGTSTDDLSTLSSSRGLTCF